MNLIKIDASKCTKCGLCFRVCWQDVFRIDPNTSEPIVKYPEDCVECNYCELSCPAGALTVVIDYSNRIAKTY